MTLSPAYPVSFVQSAQTPELHYARYTPLPAKAGELTYHRSPGHAVACLEYASVSTLINDITHDKQKLVEHTKRFAWISSLTLLIEVSPHSAITANQKQSITRELENFTREKLKLDAAVFAANSGSYKAVYSLMTKADIGFFAGSALYPDAFRVRLPAVLWRQHKNRDISLNAFWENPSEIENPIVARKKIATQQLMQLERLNSDSIRSDQAIVNSQKILSQTIIDALSQWIPTESISLNATDADSNVDQPIINLPFDNGQRSLGRRLKHRYSRNQRKLIKLQQSPTKFLQDSSHPIIKRLLPFITKI